MPMSAGYVEGIDLVQANLPPSNERDPTQLPEGIGVQCFRLWFMNPRRPAHQEVKIPPHDGIGSMLRNEHAGAAPSMSEVIAKGIVDSYADKLKEFGFGDTTTEVKLLKDTDSGEYYRAEDEHQQYLYKVPNGYCPHHSTGVKCD